MNAKESELAERLLLALGQAQPDAAYLLGLTREALAPGTAASEAQRALLLRVLAQLAEKAPDVVRADGHRLRPLVQPILHADDAERGSKAPPQLAATLLCLPYFWPPTTGEREVADLRRIAHFMGSEHRELCYHASLCLRMLTEAQPLELTPPALMAVARMLLACDGAATTQLQRALNISFFLVSSAMDALPEHLDAMDPSGADDGDDDGGDGGGGASSGVGVGRWHELRVTMQAACLMWLQHSVPEIVQQAAALL